jgi:hypothetical protein
VLLKKLKHPFYIERSIEMKSKLLFLGLLSAVIIFASPPTAKAAVNMLTNPSFEDDTDDDAVPDSWGFWDQNISNGGDGYTVYYEADSAHPARSGDDCVGFYGTAYALCHQDFLEGSFEVGQTYYHAFYVKDIYPGGSLGAISPTVEFWTDPDRSIGTKTTADSATFVPNDGKWHLIGLSCVVPEGIRMVVPAPIMLGGAEAEYLIDDAWFSTDPLIRGATNPVPPDGGSITPLIEELSWTNPEAASPAEPIKCDVWFSYDFPEYGSHEGDPNFTSYATKIVDYQSGDTASLTLIPTPLVENMIYYWRVDCYDPNLIDNPDDYFMQGQVWTFNTFNQPPEVEAGRKQKAWLTEATVSVQLDATATDDGMPLDPGAITLQWTLEDGPDTPTFTPGDNVEDPLVTFDTTGRYILKLTADDDELTAYDTVIIDIYPADYTGLVAHWQLDEDTGSIAYDSVDAHDGTLVDDAAWAPSEGQVAGAILLDGDGDFVKIDDSADADPVNTTWADFSEEITISCWLKVNEFTDDYQAIVSKGEDAYRIQRNGTGDSIWFTITPYTINAGAAGTLSVNDGKWHHITATYDNEFIRLYIDGYPDGETEYADGISVGESSLLIGENIGYERSFNGLIDEVRIYEIGLPYDRILEGVIADGGKGSCGQVYKKSDINQDCYVNLLDLAELAAMWLECSDVTEPSCFE